MVILFPPPSSAVRPGAVVARLAAATEASTAARDEQQHDYRGSRASGAVGGRNLGMRLARVRTQLQQRIPALKVRLKAVLFEQLAIDGVLAPLECRPHARLWRPRELAAAVAQAARWPLLVRKLSELGRGGVG